MSKKIILLAGPTASGKSKLAIHLAKKLNGEIINADSMQIYKEFSVLSSSPDNKETKKVKHNFSHFNLEAIPYLVKVKKGKKIKNTVWVDFKNVESLGLPAPVKKTINQITMP